MQETVELQNLEDIQFVYPKQIPKHLCCSICLFTYYYPIRLECGHTFCKRCLDTLKLNSPSKCPECRKIVDQTYATEDQIAHSLIQEQLVFCRNKPNLCSWRGKLRDLQSHLYSCNFKNIDEECKSVVESFEQKVKQRIIGSDLNRRFFHETLIDEKFQENINQNVGESLLTRLLNKDKIMATNIIHSISQLRRSEKFPSAMYFPQNQKEICTYQDSTNIIQEKEKESQKELVNDRSEQDELLDLFSEYEEPYQITTTQNIDVLENIQDQEEKKSDVQGKKKRIYKKRQTKQQKEQEIGQEGQIIMKTTPKKPRQKRTKKEESSQIYCPAEQSYQVYSPFKHLPTQDIFEDFFKK